MRRKLKVLHVVDGFRMGGAENKLAELIERLDSSKFEQHLANVGPLGPLYDRFRSLKVPLYQCQRRHRFDLRPVLQLRKIMQRQRIDIVQTTLFWADFAGILAAHWAGVPVVLSWETVTHEGDPYHNKLQRKAGYHLVMKYADGVIAVSHEIKDSLIRRRGLAAERIYVIHYGVDLNRFHRDSSNPSGLRESLGLAPDALVFGIIARLEPVKGHRYFLEAFANVAKRHPEAQAILVGDGSLRGELESQTRQAGLEGRIHFLGIREDVNALLNVMDVFVLPSIAGEGLPNVVLEAMACGLPVVATRVGGTPEAVLHGKTGFIVEPANPEALAQAMEALIADETKRKAFGNASRRRAESEFSLQKQLAEFENLYIRLYEESTKKRQTEIRAAQDVAVPERSA